VVRIDFRQNKIAFFGVLYENLCERIFITDERIPGNLESFLEKKKRIFWRFLNYGTIPPEFYVNSNSN
jgi:hypothetical protein